MILSPIHPLRAGRAAVVPTLEITAIAGAREPGETIAVEVTTEYVTSVSCTATSSYASIPVALSEGPPGVWTGSFPAPFVDASALETVLISVSAPTEGLSDETSVEITMPDLWLPLESVSATTPNAGADVSIATASTSGTVIGLSPNGAAVGENSRVALASEYIGSAAYQVGGIWRPTSWTGATTHALFSNRTSVGVLVLYDHVNSQIRVFHDGGTRNYNYAWSLDEARSVIVTHDGVDTQRVYVDGVELVSSPQTFGVQSAGGEPFGLCNRVALGNDMISDLYSPFVVLGEHDRLTPSLMHAAMVEFSGVTIGA